MAKVWPVGVFGICMFNLVAWATVTRLGLPASISLGYAADLGYLLVFDIARRVWLGREAAGRRVKAKGGAGTTREPN